MARPEAVQGNRPFLTLMPWGLGLVFRQTHPRHFGVCVGHAWNHPCVERRGRQLFVALQFTGDDFSGHVRLMHRLGAHFLLAGTAGFFHTEVVCTHKMAVATHRSQLAHFGHGGQATSQLADEPLGADPLNS